MNCSTKHVKMKKSETFSAIMLRANLILAAKINAILINYMFNFFNYRANYLGTQFTIFNNGSNPNKGVSEDDIREELISIIYVI